MFPFCGSRGVNNLHLKTGTPDEREAHQPTAPAPDSRYTSCSVFCAERSKSIFQPVPLLTIECLRSAGSQQLLSTLHSSEFARTDADPDAAIILTSSLKRFPVRQGRDFNHQDSVCTMQFKDCREGSSRQSCLCPMFARLNSLRSWMGQNANSPFSNIRAVTSKLYQHSRPR